MKYVIIGAIIFIILIILHVSITVSIMRILNKLDMNDKKLDSKINDLNYNFKTPIYHIERMCDAIDQRTKAHLSKKKIDKDKTHLSKREFKRVMSSVNEVKNDKK